MPIPRHAQLHAIVQRREMPLATADFLLLGRS
jgi:hypothetical protein